MGNEKVFLLAGLFNATRAQAASAHGDGSWRPLHQHAMARDIQVLAALADVVRVTDLTTGLWPPSADLAACGMSARHSDLPIWSVALERSLTDDWYCTTSSWQNQAEKLTRTVYSR